MAGVYAMAGLADDWVDKRQVCADVLCGYLRISAEDGAGEEEVRGAVLRVIRERLGERAWQDVDFDFTGVEFEDADFAELDFGGRVVFDGVRFFGELTSFDSTVFQGY